MAVAAAGPTQEAEGEVKRLRERLAYVQQPYHYLVEKLQARNGISEEDWAAHFDLFRRWWR